MTLRQQFFHAFWGVIFLLIYTGAMFLLPHTPLFQEINNKLISLIAILVASLFYSAAILFFILVLFPGIHEWLHKFEPTYHSIFSYRQFVAKLKWLTENNPRLLIGRKIVLILNNGETIRGTITSCNSSSLFLDTGESVTFAILFASQKRYDRFYGHFTTFTNRIFMDIDNIPNPAP